MSQKLHPETGTLMETIAKKYFPCTCGEIYLSRNLTAPDCPFHANDWESAMEEYAAVEYRLNAVNLLHDFFRMVRPNIEGHKTAMSKFHEAIKILESTPAEYSLDYGSGTTTVYGGKPEGEGYSREQVEDYGKQILKSISDTFLKPDNLSKASFNDQVVIQAVGETILNFPLPDLPTPSNWIEIKEGPREKV